MFLALVRFILFNAIRRNCHLSDAGTTISNRVGVAGIFGAGVILVRLGGTERFVVFQRAKVLTLRKHHVPHV